jgi:hypothetical protein
MRSALYPREVADDTPSGGKSAYPTAKAAASGAGDLSKFLSGVAASHICLWICLGPAWWGHMIDIYLR